MKQAICLGIFVACLAVLTTESLPIEDMNKLPIARDGDADASWEKVRRSCLKPRLYGKR